MINNRIIDILVVEDEMNSELLAKRIKEEFKDGIRIHKNGHGLLNDLNLYKDLDLIIVDHQYSKEDLVSALRTIRKKSPSTEVVVLSSENEPKTINNIKEAGAFDYIYKDTTALDKLMYVIRSFWGRKELVKENVHLRESRRKSKSTVTLLVFFILAIIALIAYLMYK